MRGAIDRRFVVRSPWASGPESQASGRVLVEVTVFHPAARRDLPGILRSGMQLRNDWPLLGGAVGMWLWTRPLSGTCGSVSVWRDSESLLAFVARPDHVDVMRRYRRRGHLTSTSWSQTWDGPAPIWRRAASHVRHVPEEPARGCQRPR